MQSRKRRAASVDDLVRPPQSQRRIDQLLLDEPINPRLDPAFRRLQTDAQSGDIQSDSGAAMVPLSDLVALAAANRLGSQIHAPPPPPPPPPPESSPRSTQPGMSALQLPMALVQSFEVLGAMLQLSSADIQAIATVREMPTTLEAAGQSLREIQGSVDRVLGNLQSLQRQIAHAGKTLNEISPHSTERTAIKQRYEVQRMSKSKNTVAQPIQAPPHDTLSDAPTQAPVRSTTIISLAGTDSSDPTTAIPSLYTRRNDSLVKIAAETLDLLPAVLDTLSKTVYNHSLLYSTVPGDDIERFKIEPLRPEACPRIPGVKIEVYNADSLDIANLLTITSAPGATKPVCILNMANGKCPGGGFLEGAMAQEEAMCYRSSLSVTLDKSFCPLPDVSGLYSPQVVVIRENHANGHRILNLDNPRSLPIYSVISVAAIEKPILANTNPPTYQRDYDRELMKEKMRTILRMAAVNGHRRLVLGALGCGIYANPREEVVSCWSEVFEEVEFSGGWFERVVLAVLDTGAMETFAVFDKALHGKPVSL